jgi:cytochrome c oxidase subunit 2
MMQETVFLITVVLMSVVAGGFAFVAFNAGSPAESYGSVQQASYSSRRKFFSVLVAAGVLILAATTTDLPYKATRGEIPNNAKIINVDGRQWYWDVAETQFNKGDTVVFNVTASDVSHGLGIYDPNMNILTQTQAMPGYSNLLKISFEEVGSYKLVCMEYCGLAHHAMITPIKVSD